MVDIAFAIAPIFILILVGWGLHHRKVFDDQFWVPAEKLTYYVLFPALLFKTTATSDVPYDVMGSMLAAMVAATLIVAALFLLSQKVWKLGGPALTSGFQGVIRPNTYVGFAAAAALLGPSGLSLIAAQAVVVIPLVNLLSVLVLLRWGQTDKPRRNGAMGLILPIIGNPLIIACLAGGAWNYLGLPLPRPVLPTLEILSSAALPLALLATGAGLDFKAMRAASGTVLASGIMKLILLPVLAGGISLSLGLADEAMLAVVIYAALPVSVSTYVLARQLGGDGPLAAAVITASTIASAVTIPVLVSIAQRF